VVYSVVVTSGLSNLTAPNNTMSTSKLLRVASYDKENSIKLVFIQVAAVVM